jgi:hypothetical protein
MNKQRSGRSQWQSISRILRSNENSVITVVIPAQIRTGYIPNISFVYCRYTNMFRSEFMQFQLMFLFKNAL